MINIQPVLQNELVILNPLQLSDFDDLYQVARDPQIWQQHPNKDRWQIDVFQRFFTVALNSRGAFKIIAQQTGKTVGSTRFYDYDAQQNSILIGYTFYAVNCWGTGLNRAVKKLMLDYIFTLVDKVYFHVAEQNIRSQIAVERLGATKITSKNINDAAKLAPQKVVYLISKEQWCKS